MKKLGKYIHAVVLIACVLLSKSAVAESSSATLQLSKKQADSLVEDQPFHLPPAYTLIPNDKYGDEVTLGLNIFTKTQTYASRYVGNGLNCSNCHLDGGRKPNAAPLWAAYGMYPTYRAREDRNITIQERIQMCFQFSLNGFKPALDAPEMRALVSYMHFLSKGVPSGVEMPGRGYPQILKTGQDANPTRGKDVYQSKCVFCHGESGEGQKSGEDEQGAYQVPPLWGMDSYNKGAGFSRVEMLAGFIKANMPLGQGWSLTDQEALDVAAFINRQMRPWNPRKGFLKGFFE